MWRLTRRNEWDEALLQRSRYHAFFDRLASKAQKSPRIVSSCPGLPECSLDALVDTEDVSVKLLLRSLRQNKFCFEPATRKEVVLDKPRDLYLSNWLDRAVLTVMAEILAERAEPQLPENLYSFRKGRGSHGALAAAATYLRNQDHGADIYVLKRDVSKYGDNIPHAMLLNDLAELFPDLRVSQTFAPLLTRAIRAEYRAASEHASLCRGLATGSPLVPILENIFLLPLDRELQKVPASFYARYGDDILFLTTQEDKARATADFIDRILNERGLHVKAEKRGDWILRRDRSRPVPQGFQSVQSFLWLGLSLDALGVLRPKPQALQSLRLQLRQGITGLVQRVSRFPLSESQRNQAINQGLTELLNAVTNPELGHVVHTQKDLQVMRDLDQFATLCVVNGLRKYGGIRKREAWRKFRQLSLPSMRRDFEARENKKRPRGPR